MEGGFVRGKGKVTAMKVLVQTWGWTELRHKLNGYLIWQKEKCINLNKKRKQN